VTLPSAKATEPRRIVATDDDPKLLASLTYALRDAGHLVFAAYNGLSACHLATTTPELDLLITNTRLRDLEAPELIRRVREVRPRLPILHIGEPLPEGDASLAQVPTLREPFNRDQLLAAVAEALTRGGDST
jgi:DNA-binding response OmpR family regulator